jgi:anti-anti-sigma factor
VIAVEGRVDSSSVDEFRSVLTDVIAEGGIRLVADFSKVEFMSSASLRVIADVLKEVRSKGGDLRLAGVRAPVAKIFDLTGFAGILRMHPDVETAAASYETGQA